MTKEIIAYDNYLTDRYKVEPVDERRYEYDGNVYRFRDQLIVYEDGRVQFKNNEYATKDKAGNTVWKHCRQGVNFADIEPFEPVAA